MLDRLAGLDITPEVLDYLTFGGHEFLVLEHVAGSGGVSPPARRSPQTSPRAPARRSETRRSPPGCVGFDIDDYSLASLALFMFLPLTELIAWDPSKVEEFAGVIAETFPVPANFLEAPTVVITGSRSVIGIGGVASFKTLPQ